MRKVFYNQQTNKVNPSFHFHAPGSKHGYPCIQTASAVPKYFSCLLQFCTGYRIWHASRVWKRKTARSWKYPDTTNTFSLFLDDFLWIDLRPIYCSLTTRKAVWAYRMLHRRPLISSPDLLFKCKPQWTKTKHTACRHSVKDITQLSDWRKEA